MTARLLRIAALSCLCLLMLAGPRTGRCATLQENPPWPESAPSARATALCPSLENILEFQHEKNGNSADKQLLQRALAHLRPTEPLPRLEILNPLPHGVYPRDAAAPRIVWETFEEGSGPWLVEILLPDGAWATVLTGAPQWTPDVTLWETIRERSQGGECRLTVTLLDAEGKPLAQGRSFFGVSSDALDAAIFYQQIPLPFLFAQDHPELTRWLVADPASPEPPRVVLGGLRHCGNCHTFSGDAATFGMDIDYYKDKGGYVFMPVAEQMLVGQGEMFSWNDYRPEDGVVSMGLFTKISPDGAHAVTTVKEKSMFSPLDDVEFCQFFFPIRGHLACFSRRDRSIRPLPGADSPDFVQTSPAWSPDGKRIVFARAPLDQRLIEAMGDRKFLPAGEDRIEDFNERYPYRYDLYVLDFNGGQGGKARALAGASDNGMSNYFPRFSPNGRWVVFCRSETGLVLQPSSELWIVPAEGGEARRLECNTDLLNSWHSFSPNGRWLLFSSKQNTPFTEVLAAHLDENGHAARPVVLDRLSHPERASIIPEAVDRSALRIQRIELARP
ncbi:MAG: TolB family protein [Desulfovibrio sp.]